MKIITRTYPSDLKKLRKVQSPQCTLECSLQSKRLAVGHTRIQLFVILLLLCLSFSTVQARHALWIWGMSDDIILSDQERLTFWSFIEAPHGEKDMKITRIYICSIGDMLNKYPDKVGEFIADAHSRGIKVDYLTGQPTWALTIKAPNGQPYNQPSFDELNDLLRYNASVRPVERFDGYQQDTEPYVLGGEKHPLSWGTDKEKIWDQYMETVSTWRSMIDAHNEAVGDTLEFGIAIPRWWDPMPGTKVSHKPVQDIADYIAIMNYDTRPHVSKGVQSEIKYAQSKGYKDSVHVGMETFELAFKEGDAASVYKQLYTPSASYFYGDGNGMSGSDFLIQDSASLESTFEQSTAYSCNAFHYYEDVDNGENSFRLLGKSKSQHAPCAWIMIPSFSEVFSGSEKIHFMVYDPDGDPLKVKVEYSRDDDNAWYFITYLEIKQRTDEMIYRAIPWDVSDLTASSNYRIRITATEMTPLHLSGYDESDFNFTITKTKKDEEKPTAVHLASIQSSPFGPGKLTLQWEKASDNEGIAGYFYSYESQGKPTIRSFSRANKILLDAPYVDSVLKIRTVDHCGNASEPTAYAIPAVKDMDRDGISDDSENEEDIDGDGVSNADEILEGTDPNNPMDFSTARVVGYWQFEDNLKNAITEGPSLKKEVVSKGRFSYQHTDTLRGKAAKLSGKMPAMLVSDDNNNHFGEETHALTIEMWIQPDSNSRFDLSYIPLASFGDIDNGLTFLLNNDSGFISIRRHLSEKNGKYESINVSNEQLFDGNWHHVACSYNGYNRMLKLYIDGQLVNQRQHPHLLSFPKNSRALRFFDGRSNFDTDNNMPPNSDANINSAKFENNRFNFRQSKVRYLGLVDNIKITKAAVPQQRLDYYRER